MADLDGQINQKAESALAILGKLQALGHSGTFQNLEELETVLKEKFEELKIHPKQETEEQRSKRRADRAELKKLAAKYSETPEMEELKWKQDRAKQLIEKTKSKRKQLLQDMGEITVAVSEKMIKKIL